MLYLRKKYSTVLFPNYPRSGIDLGSGSVTLSLSPKSWADRRHRFQSPSFFFFSLLQGRETRKKSRTITGHRQYPYQHLWLHHTVPTSRIKMNFMLYRCLVVFCAVLFSASAIENCEYIQSALDTAGNTCIKLELCNPSGMCPILTFPVCGKISMLLLSLNVLLITNSNRINRLRWSHLLELMLQSQ